tara:strand:- start:454 stop:1338 length:885 start_codon:yes stop_codon:yes gene_type:complete
MTGKLGHAERVRDELKAAGLTRWNLRRFTSSYLPQVIHPDEQIMAAISGRHKEVEGAFGLIEGMLVATDRRVIYLDHRPGYTTMDEISYDVISGVNLSRTLFSASVTLYSKVDTYTLSYSRMPPAQKFVDYIEAHTLTAHSPDPHETKLNGSFSLKAPLSKRAYNFLADHQSGVLSSLDASGHAMGATVYYMLRDATIYFVTKSSSRKAAGILRDSHVALTVTDEAALKTLQLQGMVSAVTDRSVIDEVIGTIIVPRDYEEGRKLPPIMRTEGDRFIVFQIEPTTGELRDYNRA